jgi:hypothetical protein
MRNIWIFGLLGFSLFGCGMAPKHSSNEPWEPKCKVVNCFDDHAFERPPVGAKLSFAMCTGNIKQEYTYVREKSTWKVIEMRSEYVEKCPESVGDGD